MSAVINQAAADEHGRRHLVKLRQLADRIEHNDVGARLRVDWQLGTPDGDETGIAREPFCFAEPLRMPGRHDAQRTRGQRLHAPERIEDRRLLAFHRAAGDDDRTVRRQPEEPKHALARLAVRGWSRPLERIELQAAGHRDARGIGAKIDETAG